MPTGNENGTNLFDVAIKFSKFFSLPLFYFYSDEGCISHSTKYRKKATGVPNKFLLFFGTPSGERLLSTKSGCPLNRGQIRLISYIGGKESCTFATRVMTSFFMWMPRSLTQSAGLISSPTEL
eukprot:sb/3475832/